MDLRALVSRYFGPRVCLGCEAHRDHIASLREEVVDLRSEKDHLRETLFRVTRIQSEPADSKVQKTHVDPVQTRVAKSWHQLQRELEQKHKRKPDDVKHDYWAKKSEGLETRANLLAPEETLNAG